MADDTILGSGDFKFRLVPDWAKLPDGWDFGDVAAVGVDSKDHVYVFNRGEHPMIVFDRDGNFLRSWGEGMFKRAHGAPHRARRHDLSAPTTATTRCASARSTARCC